MLSAGHRAIPSGPVGFSLSVEPPSLQLRQGQLRLVCRNFPGGPMVKTLSSNAGSVGSIPGQGAKILHALGPQSQNIKTEAIS